MARIDGTLDDVLGDPRLLENDHPHRIPLRWNYERRGGSVPPRAAHCISPVRRGDSMRQPGVTAR